MNEAAVNSVQAEDHLTHDLLPIPHFLIKNQALLEAGSPGRTQRHGARAENRVPVRLLG